MEHPRRAARDPLKGAALAVRQSRPGGALDGASSFVASCLSRYALEPLT